MFKETKSIHISGSKVILNAKLLMTINVWNVFVKCKQNGPFDCVIITDSKRIFFGSVKIKLCFGFLFINIKLI